MDQTDSVQLPLLSKKEKDISYIYYNNIAIFISTTSFFYNILEGAVSVYFGEVNDSLSLFFFGVQSFVEVLSSIIVLWKVVTSYKENKNQIKTERRATVVIGCLFIFLSIGILIDGVFSIVDHSYPTNTLPNVIVSAVATLCMLALWTVKKKLARELNSSTIQSDAQCSLACIRITVLLLFGSLAFHIWHELWWIDGAMALILGILFGKEGIQMLVWARSKDFNGGCCGGCAKMPVSKKIACATSLSQNEYYGIQNISQDEVGAPKSGGCCKGGSCSKTTSESQKITSAEVILEVSNPEETKPNPSPKKCCSGGKCSKKTENQNITPVEVVIESSRVGVTETKPQEEIVQQPPAKKCCSGGKCSKKAENQGVTVTPTDMTNPISISQEESNKTGSPQITLQEESVPKTTGGCCKNGKCSKKAESQNTISTDINSVIPTLEKAGFDDHAITEIRPQEEIIIKPAGGCCKGGKCSKKAENMGNVVEKAEN